MKLGNIEITEKAALAPLAGVADRAFRELCRGYGAAYTVCEMASAKGISLGDKKSADLLSITETERPAGSQIFGNSPETMAIAAKKALEYSPDFIDINMGCPAPKVASSGGGALLMKDPVLAANIVKAVAEVSTVPVTVKMRLGWDKGSINCVEFAKAMEQAHENGSPVMRPLFYNFPEDKKAWDMNDAYCFGDDLLIAPVFEAGAVERTVYLPQGTVWVEVNTGKCYEGGQTVTVAAPVDVIPVFAREGAAVLELF